MSKTVIVAIAKLNKESKAIEMSFASLIWNLKLEKMNIGTEVSAQYRNIGTWNDRPMPVHWFQEWSSHTCRSIGILGMTIDHPAP